MQPINGLIKKFSNTYGFSNRDINEFVLLLRKGVYPYEYVGSWERFGKTSLPDKKAFYIEFNLEDIADEDKTVHMLKKYLKNLNQKALVTIPACMFKVVHYWLQMCLRTLEISVLKYINLILLIFLSAPRLLAW